MPKFATLNTFGKTSWVRQFLTFRSFKITTERDFRITEREPNQSWKDTYFFSRFPPLLQGQIGLINHAGQYRVYTVDDIEDPVYLNVFPIRGIHMDFFDCGLAYMMLPTARGKRLVSQLFPARQRRKYQFRLPNGLYGHLDYRTIEFDNILSGDLWDSFIQARHRENLKKWLGLLRAHRINPLQEQIQQLTPELYEWLGMGAPFTNDRIQAFRVLDF